MPSKTDSDNSWIQWLPFHVFRVQADGQIIDYNFKEEIPPFKKQSNIKGKYFQELNLVQDFDSLLDRCQQEGQHVVAEYDYQEGKSSYRLRARLQPESNDQFVLTIEEIMPVPQSKPAIHNSSFKKLTISISGPYFRTDEAGVLIEIGESVPFQMDLAKEKIIGKRLDELFAEPRNIRTFQIEVKAAKELVYAQFKVKKGKQSHHLLLAAQANFDHLGAYKGITGLVQRISTISSSIKYEGHSEIPLSNHKESLVIVDIENGAFIASNQPALELFVCDSEQLKLKHLSDVFTNFDLTKYRSFRANSGTDVDFVFKQKIDVSEGEQLDVIISVRPLLIGGGQFCQFIIKDMTPQILQDKIEKLQQNILKKTISGESDVEVLKYICSSFEEIFQGSYCTYLKYDAKHETLSSYVSSGMPKYYTDAVKNVKIGPDVGACGRAAFIKKMVFMSDILNHPNWKPWLSVVTPTGMKSCWSVPVLTGNREVLGTFSVYYKTQKLPKRREIRLINQLAYVIGLMVEKVNNEERAASSESRYQSLLDDSPVGIAIHRKGNILFMNRSAKELLGLSDKDLTVNGYKNLPQSFLDCVTSNKVLKSRKKSTFQEFEIEDAKGDPHYVMMKANKVQFDDEDAMQVVFHDITPRRTAEDKLRDSQEQFELAISGSSAGIWDWYNIEKGKVWWAPKIYELLDYEDTSMQPDFNEVGRFIHPHDRKETFDKLHKYLDSRGEFSVEFRLLRGSGDYGWFFCSGQAVWDKRGRATRMVGSIVDIHEQKSSQELLKSREQLLNRTGNLGKIGGWELELEQMNLTWTDQTYYIHELDLGNTPTVEEAINFYHPEDRGTISKAVENCIKGENFSLKLRLITARGNLLRVKAEGYPEFKGKKVVKIVGAFQDITSSESQQLVIQESERKLKMANKIARIGHWQWNLNDNSVYWSDELFEILGVDSDQRPNMECIERIIHPAYQAKYFDYMLHSLKNEELEARDIAIIRPNDGKLKYISVRSVNSFDQTGRIEKTLGTVQDITDRKELEISLNTQNKHIRIQHDLSQTAAKANNNWFLVHSFCQVLVKEIGYDWVWISSQENLALGQVWPVAHCIHESYQKNDQFNDLLKYEKKGPMSDVITGKFDYLICDLTREDNAYAEWREMAKSFNIHTAIYLPYFHGDEIIGTVNIYSCLPTDIGEERISFLRQYADKLGSSTYALELKKNKEELNDFNKLLVDSLHVASAKLDKHSGQIIFTGDTKALVGYTEKELVNLMSDIEKHFYASDIMKFEQEMEKSRENKGYFNFDFKFRNKEGRFVWINAIGKTYWQFNAIRKIVGILINTDEKKAAEMNLMKAQIMGGDKERERIAQQLHDGLSQLLTVASMGLSSLKKTLGPMTAEKEELLDETMDLVNTAIVDSRELSHELMPAKVKRGLVPAINSLVNRLKKTVETKITFFHHNTDRRYRSDIETNFYYIINEAVNNILKHAQATKVEIQLLEIDDLLVLMIDDNGVGFDLNAKSSEDGIGLSNIKSRVLSINGELTIESKNGTQILIEIRLEPDHTREVEDVPDDQKKLVV